MKRFRCSLLAFVVTAAVVCVAQTKDADAKELIRIEQELQKAHETGATAAPEKYLAMDFVVRSPDGRAWDKAAALQTAKLQAERGETTKESMEDVQTAVLGRYSLITYKLRVQFPNQVVLVMQMADTFHKDEGGWQVVTRIARPLK